MTSSMRHGLGDCTAENHCGCLAGAPTDHTAAIADAAREYVRTRRAHLDHGPLMSARKAAHDALIAAVEAERAERGQA